MGRRRRRADPEHDEVARRAALRRAAHDLGRRPPTSSTCSRTRWWRSTGTARRRSPISPSRGRSARTASSTPSSCATTCSFCSGKKFTADDVVYSFKRLTSPEHQGAARLARRQPQGDPRAPIPTRSSTSWPSPTPTCCCSSPCSPTRSTTRRASRRWARTTASRAPTAPARGASNRGSRAPRSCSSATTPTSGAPRCTRTRGR